MFIQTEIVESQAEQPSSKDSTRQRTVSKSSNPLAHLPCPPSAGRLFDTTDVDAGAAFAQQGDFAVETTVASDTVLLQRTDSVLPVATGSWMVYSATNELVKVAEVHLDDPQEVYYTVIMADGREKQTTRRRLQRPTTEQMHEKVDADALEGEPEEGLLRGCSVSSLLSVDLQETIQGAEADLAAAIESGDQKEIAIAEQTLAEAKAAELVELAEQVADNCSPDGSRSGSRCNTPNDTPRSSKIPLLDKPKEKSKEEAWFQKKSDEAAADPAVAYEVVKSAFNLIDANGDGVLSRTEVIKALRSSVVVRLLLQLPQNIRQEDGTREIFEHVFQTIDTDGSDDISMSEFSHYFLNNRGWFCDAENKTLLCGQCGQVNEDGWVDPDGFWFCSDCWEGATDETYDSDQEVEPSRDLPSNQSEMYMCEGCECAGTAGGVDPDGYWFCTECWDAPDDGEQDVEASANQSGALSVDDAQAYLDEAWESGDQETITVANQVLAEARAAEVVDLARQVAEHCTDGTQNDVPSREETWFHKKTVVAVADPAVALEVIKSAFKLIDINDDRYLSRTEVIKALHDSVEVRLLLQLPQNIRQEDGTREIFEKVFQAIDADNSTQIDIDEFEQYFLNNRGLFRGCSPRSNKARVTEGHGTQNSNNPDDVNANLSREKTVQLAKQTIGGEDWVCKIDKASNRPYWFSVADKQPQWDAPAGWNTPIRDPDVPKPNTSKLTTRSHTSGWLGRGGCWRRRQVGLAQALSSGSNRAIAKWQKEAAVAKRKLEPTLRNCTYLRGENSQANMEARRDAAPG